MAIERIAGAGGLIRGELVRVMVGGVPVCVARTHDGRLFAVGDACSHYEVPLSEGHLTGAELECPLHASVFDLASGEPKSLPATRPIPTYQVIEDGRDLLISWTAAAADPESHARGADGHRASAMPPEEATG